MDYKKLKEFVSDKHNRALVIMGLYLIFFIFMGVFFRTYTGDKKIENNTKTPIQVFSELSNYEYSYDYKVDDNLTSISGKVYKNTNYMTMDNVDYYISDKSYQIIDDGFKEIELNKLFCITPSMIYNYVLTGKVVAKNEDYETNTTTTKYSIYLSKLDETITNGIFYVTVYETSNVINHISIDVTNYLKQTEEINNATIDINYFNIDGVSNFTNVFNQNKVIEGVEE